jgi:hypothetical protein
MPVIPPLSSNRYETPSILGRPPFRVLGMGGTGMSTVQTCVLTSIVFILVERFLGNQALGLDINTFERFALAWASCYIAVMFTPSLINMAPSLAMGSQLLTSVVAGGVYTGADMFLNFDSSSPMFKFLYLTGSSFLVSYL